MAKCIGFTTDWSVKNVEQTTDLPVVLSDDTIKGEEILCKQLQDVTSLVMEIITNFILTKYTIGPNDMKYSCSELRDNLMSSLKRLNLQTHKIALAISNSKVTQFVKQNYFITYSSGVIAKLQQLLSTLGRVSELEQRIFLADQQNPFVSNESTLIHSLTTIWSASVNIMNNFQGPSRAVFNQDGTDPDDYNFTDHLECSTSGQHHAKVFLMDLLITSWIQFNRLVKFDDLVKGLPFLCACHCRLFFNTVRLLDEEERGKILCQLLPLFIDYISKPSLITESERQHNIVPMEPCYGMADQQSLAYFVVWNIYALSRIVKPIDKPMISNSRNVLESSYSIAIKQFEAIIDQPGYQLSPHQEERHKLLTHMKYSLDNSDTTTSTSTSTTTII